MTTTKIHTWARVMRLDLQHLSVGLGNAVVADRANWPASGDGRNVKALTERVTRMLDATFDRDIHHVFDCLTDVAAILKHIKVSDYFRSNIGGRKYKNRVGNIATFSDSLDGTVKKIEDYAEANRPERQNTPPTAVASSDRNITQGVGGAKKPASLLRNLTPSQQEGPLQFTVQKGVMRLKPQVPHPEKRDLQTIRSARESVSENSAALLNAMVLSNCDPRLLEAVRDVNTIIQSKADVIRLGLANIACEQLFEHFQNEVPEIAVARFRGLAASIQLYVSQFPEWQRFAENAAQLEYDVADIQETYDLGRQLLPHLQSAVVLIDPEVPKSIELVLEALTAPKRSGQRALYGAVRVLENLIAKIFSECAGLLDATFSGMRGGIKKATTVTVAAALILATAHLAGMLSPIAERVVKANWMNQAADLISKNSTLAP